RLTIETCKAARHILQMCIRALDYCPPVDITFGEYLRAIITADVDGVSNDRYGYRVAVMEACRKYAILPRDVRAISPESLAWTTPDESRAKGLADVVKAITIHWNGKLSRSEIFKLGLRNCDAVRQALDKVFSSRKGRNDLYRLFGLRPNVPEYNARGK